jgi:hypothetical protein
MENCKTENNEYETADVHLQCSWPEDIQRGRLEGHFSLQSEIWTANGKREATGCFKKQVPLSCSEFKHHILRGKESTAKRLKIILSVILYTRAICLQERHKCSLEQVKAYC